MPSTNPPALDTSGAAPAAPPAPGPSRVVVDDRTNPFERLDPDARVRLLVRVLCGLVAYEDDDERDADVIVLR